MDIYSEDGIISSEYIHRSAYGIGMKQLLQDWVTRQADRRPDATAVVYESERLTYGQLEAASNQLANTLRQAGCKKGDRVGFLMPKSPNAAISMIGILKAGCMHVPIDAASPATRIRKILDSCENRWLLAAGPMAGLLDELLADPAVRRRISIGWMESNAPSGEHIAVEFNREDLDRAPSDLPPQQTATDDPAHILFTSGSTGMPKGVVITHSNVIHFVEWGLKHFGIDSSDRLSGHTPLHFDLSTFDVFGTFAAGAELHMVPQKTSALPSDFVRFIRNSQLTQWFSVPSVLNYVFKFDVLKHNDFPLLRRILWCGEVLPTPALIYWMQRLPHVRFTNLYGPTEATIASSYYDVPACPANERAQIPIGTACDGEELLVLDETLRPVPPGVIGDLYIRGVGLSPGYWRDPDKTAAAFLLPPGSTNSDERLYRTGDLARRDEMGLLHFIGRRDTQIKSRGYRIELGEIEASLNSLRGLRESAVVALPTDGFEGWLICCAYVPRAGSGVTPGGLREDLGKLIPNYMLPANWMEYDALPKNANGKIDRPLIKNHFDQAQSRPPVARQGRDAGHEAGRDIAS